MGGTCRWLATDMTDAPLAMSSATETSSSEKTPEVSTCKFKSLEMMRRQFLDNDPQTFLFLLTMASGRKKKIGLFKDAIPVN